MDPILNPLLHLFPSVIQKTSYIDLNFQCPGFECLVFLPFHCRNEYPLINICYCKQKVRVPFWALKINRGNWTGLLIKAYRGKIPCNSDLTSFFLLETPYMADPAKRGHRTVGCVENKAKYKWRDQWLKNLKYKGKNFQKPKCVLKHAPLISTEVRLEG